MYGFLRPFHCNLPQEDRKDYQRYYCGQCGAIQRHYGYPWRALVSYDAAFFGMLLAAQEETLESIEKAWCAVFPRKVAIADTEERATIFAASMAIIIFSLQCEDDRKDGRLSWRSMIAKIGLQKVQKAKVLLDSLGFPVELFDVSTRQARVECASNRGIRDYAEPSARFLAETFRWTAKATSNPENEEALYNIGYHTGRLIYMADGCIDILDDLEKKEFNALMASGNANVGTFSQKVHSEVVTLAMESLEQIRALAKAIHLKRYKSLIENILIHGFPGMVHKRIIKSIRRLEKERPMLLKYLPHTALASALCLFMTRDAVASGYVVWGEKAYGDSLNYIAYGCACCKNECVCCDILVNPCVCVIRGTGDCEKCIDLCLQIPKTGAMGLCVWMRIQDIQEKGENRRKRFVQDNEERRRSEAEELRKHKQHEAEQHHHNIYSRNQDFFTKKTVDIQYELQRHGISRDYTKEARTYIEQHLAEEWSKNSCELQRLIDQALEQARQDKQKLDETLAYMTQALDIYKSIQFQVERSGSVSLQKELAWDYDQLQPERLKQLLAQTHWDEYKKEIQYIIEDMKKIEAKARTVQPRKESYRKSVSVLDHIPTKRLLLLLNACNDQHTGLIDMLWNDIVQTEACQFGLHMDEYEYLTDRAKKLRNEINSKYLDNIQYTISGDKLPETNQLTLGGIMELYRKLKEMQEMADRSEKTLAKGKTDNIDIIHYDWRNYLTKLQGKQK